MLFHYLVSKLACLLPVEAVAQLAVKALADLLSKGLGSTSGWWMMAVLS